MGVDGSTEHPQQKVTAGADDDPPPEPGDPPPAPPGPLTGAQLPQHTEPQTSTDPRTGGGVKALRLRTRTKICIFHSSTQAPVLTKGG